LDAGDIRPAEIFAQLLTLQSSLSTAIVVYCNPARTIVHSFRRKDGIYRAGVSAEAVRGSFRPRGEIFFLGAVFI